MNAQDDKSRRVEVEEGYELLSGAKWIWSQDRTKVRPANVLIKKWYHVKGREYDGLRGWVTELSWPMGGFWVRGADGKYNNA